MIITTSLIKTFRQCPLEAYYSLQGLKQPPRPGSALDRGTYLHEWLDTGQRPQLDYEPIGSEQSIYDHLDDIYQAYKFTWGDNDLDYIASEIKLDRPMIGHPEHTIQGKLDKVVKIGNKVWVMDHKTHAKIPTYEYRQMDIQSHIYLWLLRPWVRENYPDCELGGVIWDYIHFDGSLNYPEVTKTGKLKLKNGQPTARNKFIVALWKDRSDSPYHDLSDADKELVNRHLDSVSLSAGSSGFSRVYVPLNLGTHKRIIKRVLRWAKQIIDTDWSEPPEDMAPGLCGNSYMCRYGKLAGALIDTGDDTAMRELYDIVDPLERYQ